jgi:hypothetical protein
MLFLRTAAGGFVNAATIVRLREETDGDDIRWLAICDDRDCPSRLLQQAGAA